MVWFNKKTHTTGAVAEYRSSSTEIRHSRPPTARLINARSAGNQIIPKFENIPGSEIMTLQQLAMYLCIPRSTIYRLVQTGRFPAFKVGRQWRVNLKLVQNHLLQNYVQKKGRNGSS